jgi:UDP-N-acetyl-D-mannosaminuronate dehydrogenase
MTRVSKGHRRNDSRCTNWVLFYHHLLKDFPFLRRSRRNGKFGKILSKLNIALANKWRVCLKFAQRLGSNRGENRAFGFWPLPGSGLGGHCIPVDPYHLT